MMAWMSHDMSTAPCWKKSESPSDTARWAGARSPRAGRSPDVEVDPREDRAVGRIDLDRSGNRGIRVKSEPRASRADLVHAESGGGERGREDGGREDRGRQDHRDQQEHGDRLEDTRSRTDRGLRERGPAAAPRWRSSRRRRPVSTLMRSPRIRRISARPARSDAPPCVSVLASRSSCLWSGCLGGCRCQAPLLLAPCRAMRRRGPRSSDDARAGDRSPGPDRPACPRLLEERLDEAEQAGAIVVLQLDTPGTLGQDGLALADRVAELEVPVLTWMGPVPARASGGGLLLMLASSIAGVSPGSQTGPLLPIDVLRPGAVPAGLGRRSKAGSMRTVARGRPRCAGPAPRRTWGARLRGCAGGRLHGSPVPGGRRRDDGADAGRAGGVADPDRDRASRSRRTHVEIRFEEPGLIGRVLHAVATPSMVYFLLVLGLAAIAFEITQPGFGFAGFSGVVSPCSPSTGSPSPCRRGSGWGCCCSGSACSCSTSGSGACRGRPGSAWRPSGSGRSSHGVT